MEVCIHNEEIACTKAHCERCGWNPESKVTAERLARVKVVRPPYKACVSCIIYEQEVRRGHNVQV